MPESQGDMELASLNRPSAAIIVAALAMIALVCVLIYSIQVIRDAAAQGEQTHAAMCVYKQGLAKGVHDSQAFLAMTTAQREAKYGKALGDIPDDAIRVSLIGQEKQLQHLALLSCS